MKRKIGALEGRVLYGAPKGARILPYSVGFWTPAFPLEFRDYFLFIPRKITNGKKKDGLCS